MAYSREEINIARRHIQETQEFLKMNPTEPVAPYKTMLHAQTHALPELYNEIEAIKAGFWFLQNIPSAAPASVSLSKIDEKIKRVMHNVIHSDKWPNIKKKGVGKVLGYITYKIKKHGFWKSESFENIAQRFNAMGLGYETKGDTLKAYNNAEYDLAQLENDPMSKDSRMLKPVLIKFDEEWENDDKLQQQAS